MALVPFIVAGLVTGALYALSGVGMLVLHRTTGVLNFAHGAVGALSAMLTWQWVESRMQPALAISLAVLIGAAIMVTFGAIGGGLLARLDELRKATATLGLALALLGIMLFAWNDKARTLRLATDAVSVPIGGARLNLTQLLCLALAIVVVIATALVLARTPLGAAMRALASDRELAGVLGTNVRRVELIAWTVSGAIAGASGVLLANQTRLEPGFLTFLVIPMLAAVVVGQFRSLVGTLLGGLGIGLVQSLVSAWPPVSPFSTAVPFLVATAVILIARRSRVITIEVAR